MARIETGHDKVQGTDYAYTLHGWIKGVNSNILKATNDIGKDGNGNVTVSSADVNKFNGRDVYGYSLAYFNNSTYQDYKAINGVSGTSTDFVAAAPSVQTPDLYNGNIRQMASSYLDASSPGKTYGLSSLLKNFTYDQLNRIETAGSNNSLNAGSNSWGAATGGARYSESFTYDQNGNILNAQRNGDQSASLAMDNLTYHYVSNTNKLAYVSDAVSGDPYSSDISNQSTGNYDYDAIGNLIKDNAEGISTIEWTVYGKIKKIVFASGTRELLFKYDASGNRISKTLHDFATDNLFNTTHYVRDAQGNVMATYTEMWDTGNDLMSFKLAERHIYGSSRLGVDNTTLDLIGYTSTPVDVSRVNRTLNYRSYELTNHLGNVMAVVSDRKIAVANTSPLTALDEHFTTSGGIAGWSTLGGYSATISWAGAGNIKLQTGVQNGNMAFTLPNSANVPYTLNFVNVNATGTNLKALLFDAGSGAVVSSTSLSGGLNTVSFNAPYSNLTFEIYEAGAPVGTSIVELDDISLTIPTGGATQYFTGEVLSATDYYSFGSPMPNRNFSAGSYRYGFNGKENDPETGTQDYGMRIYNPSLGRFLSVDPLAKKFPSLTPYQFASNSPIFCIDFDGLEGKVAVIRSVSGTGPDGQALPNGQPIPAGDVKGSTYQVGNTIQTSNTNNNPNANGAFIRILSVNVNQGKSTMYNNEVVKVADVPLVIVASQPNASTVAGQNISAGDVSNTRYINALAQSVSNYANQCLANESINSVNISLPQQVAGVSGTQYNQFQNRVRTAITIQLRNAGITGVPVLFTPTGVANVQNNNTNLSMVVNSTINTFGVANLAQDLQNNGVNQQTTNNVIQVIQNLNNNVNAAVLNTLPEVKNQNNPDDNNN